jgi:hypothetical protein
MIGSIFPVCYTFRGISGAAEDAIRSPMARRTSIVTITIIVDQLELMVLGFNGVSVFTSIVVKYMRRLPNEVPVLQSFAR